MGRGRKVDMDEKALDNSPLKEYYSKRFYKYGANKLALGWDKGKQSERFHQLTSDFDLNNKKILDIGCGFGDLVEYLDANSVDGYSYIGIDLVKEFIDIAQEREAKRLKGNKRKVDFICGDFLNFNEKNISDFVFASGIFNIKNNEIDMYDNLYMILQKMCDCANVAISVDMLSDRVDWTYAHNNNYNPTKVLEIAYSLSRRIILKNNYFPFEFSITIYRDDSFQKETTIFNEVMLKFKGDYKCYYK